MTPQETKIYKEGLARSRNLFALYSVIVVTLIGAVAHFTKGFLSDLNNKVQSVNTGLQRIEVTLSAFDQRLGSVSDNSNRISKLEDRAASRDVKIFVPLKTLENKINGIIREIRDYDQRIDYLESKYRTHRD